ncbi:MAG: hypothetical protein J6K86_00355 [Clostridia bacterium]|nr:hypothetical protein [Clostridia bacterium]
MPAPKERENAARRKIDKKGEAFQVRLNGEVASSSRNGSTDAGSILAVCDQIGAHHNDEMRRKCVV